MFINNVHQLRLHHAQEDVFPAFLTISLPHPELKVRANQGKSTEVDWKAQTVDCQSVLTDFVLLARNSLQGGLLREVQDLSQSSFQIG